MTEVKWAMIGCGDVTEIKSGPGLYKSENLLLLGVFNRHKEKTLDYVKRHKIEKAYGSVDELLDDPQVDAVYIATPPDSHKDYAIRCLEAGKIPYIEKPLANSYKEALEIKTLADKLNIPVFVAFYRRGLEKFIQIKKLLDQNTLGKIVLVNVKHFMKADISEKNRETLPWRVKPEISGGGKFLDMGTHMLDCLIWFFGEMEMLDGIVENRGGYYDADDTVLANFKFKNGIVGNGTWSYVAEHQINEVEIIGEKGRIVYDGLSVKDFTLFMNGEEAVFTYDSPEHISMPYQQAIITELTGGEKSFANFYEAVNLVKMTDGLLKGFYDN